MKRRAKRKVSLVHVLATLVMFALPLFTWLTVLGLWRRVNEIDAGATIIKIDTIPTRPDM